MSEVDEIDELRAMVIAGADEACMRKDYRSVRECVRNKKCPCLVVARAIRLSDEAAGYITAKLEGIVNEKDRKG